MVNRFLTGATSQGVSEEELQDGSIDINGKTLKANNLKADLPVKTDQNGTLISTKLTTDDIIGLENGGQFEQRLNNVENDTNDNTVEIDTLKNDVNINI